MAENTNFVVQNKVNSSETAKPTSGELLSGEIAVRNAAGKEALFIENTKGEVVAFSSTDALEGKVNKVKTDMSESLQTIASILSGVEDIKKNYVEKEDGKGLSSNDYTDEDKAKLVALPDEVYSKAEVNSAIANVDVTEQLKDYAKTSEVTSAISEVEQKIPSLTGYATETWVEGKGYLTSHQDITNLATKDEVDAVEDKVNAITVPTKVSQLTNDSGYQTETQVNTTIKKVVGAAPEALDTLEEIANKLADNDDAVASIVTTLSEKANSSDVYTKTTVDGLLATAASAAEGKYQPKGNYLTEHQSLADYAKTADVNTELAKKVDKVTGSSLVPDAQITKLTALPSKADIESTYATKEEVTTVDGKFANYTTTSALNTALGNKADKSTTYTKTEVDTALSTAATNVANTYETKAAHATDKTALETAINAKANSADVYTKTAADGKFETITAHNTDKTALEGAIALKADKTYVDETFETKVDHAKDYASIMSRLDDVAQVYSLYGMARVNGETSCAGTKFYGSEDNLKSIAGICHLGLVDGSGKLYKRCANGRIDKASDGTELEIDGSDGDVMVYIDRPIYVCRFTDNVEVKGDDGESTIQQLNVFAVGLAPFSVEGHAAKELKPFAFSPQYTINCKLDATNTIKENGNDKRSCAHSIYNKNIAGSYPNAASNAFSNGASFKGAAKGFPAQNMNSMNSIWQGQCKNEDEKTNRPFMGGYYEFTELWLMLMYLENKSLYHQALYDFGCGSTMSSVASATNFCTDSMAGNSGVKVVVGDKTMYLGLMSEGTLNIHYPLAALVGTSYYGFTEMLETQRLLNDISKSGLVNKIWRQKGDDANKSVIFEYNDDGNIIVSEKTIADIVNGDITSGKKYYQVRNAKTCAGMSDGVMTAVTNTFIRFDFNDGIKCRPSKDNTTGEITCTGGYAIYKFSRAVYRGMSLSFEGMFTQMQGCHYVRVNATKEWNPETQKFDGADIAAGTNKIFSFFKCVDNVDDCPALPSSSVQYFGGQDEETVMERNLNKSMLNNTSNTSGWCKKADYNYSLFCLYDYGSAQSQGEASYLWNYASWGNGDSGTINSNGTPAKGRKCVNAVVVGCNADYGCASARTVSGNGAVSSAHVVYAGRFSLPYLTL